MIRTVTICLLSVLLAACAGPRRNAEAPAESTGGVTANEADQAPAEPGRDEASDERDLGPGAGDEPLGPKPTRTTEPEP